MIRSKSNGSKVSNMDELLEIIKEINKHPICSVCGQTVGVGGEVDSRYPYYQEDNRCKACLVRWNR